MNNFLPPTIVAITMFGHVVFAESAPLYEQPVLKALGQVESGERDLALGDLGEKSRYQIKKSTWIENSNKPFAYAFRPEFASQTALNYLNRLSNQYFLATNRRPSELDIYVMWNWGFNNYQRVGFTFERAPHASRDAAIRFSNLIYKYKNKN